jgi:hypothetical protein
MANAKKSTKKVTAKKTVTAKTVTAKTTTRSTRGRMPLWAATKPQKAYVTEMRAAGKTYDAT